MHPRPRRCGQPHEQTHTPAAACKQAYECRCSTCIPRAAGTGSWLKSTCALSVVWPGGRRGKEGGWGRGAAHPSSSRRTPEQTADPSMCQCCVAQASARAGNGCMQMSPRSCTGVHTNRQRIHAATSAVSHKRPPRQTTDTGRYQCEVARASTRSGNGDEQIPHCGCAQASTRAGSGTGRCHCGAAQIAYPSRQRRQADTHAVLHKGPPRQATD